MKDLTKKDLDKIAQIKPSEFIEQYCETRLFDWQKEFIDSIPKVTHYAHSRHNNKRQIQFYKMCNHLFWMKDNDIVVVWRTKGRTLMNRDEFANYLMSEYWL